MTAQIRGLHPLKPLWKHEQRREVQCRPIMRGSADPSAYLSMQFSARQRIEIFEIRHPCCQTPAAWTR